MLVLSRNEGERITITIPPSGVSQFIEVMLVEIRSEHKARIGVQADKSIMIHREEIQRMVDSGGEIPRAVKPQITPLVRLGDPLPGERTD